MKNFASKKSQAVAVARSHVSAFRSLSSACDQSGFSTTQSIVQSKVRIGQSNCKPEYERCFDHEILLKEVFVSC